MSGNFCQKVVKNMLIKIKPEQLVVVKSSLTVFAKDYINHTLSVFPNIRIENTKETATLTGSRDELYRFLYALSRETDIELM